MSLVSTVPTNSPRVSVRGLCKSYPGVIALNDVSLDLFPGEVLAVVGENGAGKSTLMKVLAGIVRPDAGNVQVNGVAVRSYSTAAAVDLGISLIHQELNLCNNLTIAENMLLGREPNRFGWIDRRRRDEIAEVYLSKVGLDLPTSTPMEQLSVAQKQLVEIAKALSTQAIVLIMDEPTSSLSHHESERLFGLVDELRCDGVSVIYISHRLGEVLRLADRVEVLRDGINAGSLIGEAITHESMVQLMVGRQTRVLKKVSMTVTSTPRLVVRDLVVQSSHSDQSLPIDLQVKGGEIVVLAGLIGSGRSEVLESIFGVRASSLGSIRVDDVSVPRGHIDSSIASGLVMVTEDRKATGLLIESSVRYNATLNAIQRAPSYPFTRPSWERQRTAEQIDALRIKTASQFTTVETLSGGNQQKIALAKWLIHSPRVLLLDEPTRGVDIGAREEIYQILFELAAKQVAILAVSSDMEEVIAIADRVLVMHEGEIAGELTGDQINESNIIELAVGGPSQATAS